MSSQQMSKWEMMQDMARAEFRNVSVLDSVLHDDRLSLITSLGEGTTEAVKAGQEAGAKIKARRKALGFTRKQLARRLGIPRNAIVLVEAGYTTKYELAMRVTAIQSTAMQMITDALGSDETDAAAGLKTPTVLVG